MLRTFLLGPAEKLDFAARLLGAIADDSVPPRFLPDPRRAQPGRRQWSMALDKAAVAHIAALARIRLDEAELEPLAAELSHILTWFERLAEVDTADVAPMASVAATGLPMRDDKVTDGNCRDAILGNAPQQARGFFAVPKVVE
jgi:aspartyl-tRNA(Asn)/glutamyl-tRNA(Gln) amidotransferase subunit C